MKRTILDYEMKIVSKRRVIYCDDCDISVEAVVKCDACGADICEKCIGMEDLTVTQYRAAYCHTCSAIFKDNCASITKLRDQADKLEEELFYYGKKDRLEKINKKNTEDSQPK